jgi:hypothetical protein
MTVVHANTYTEKTAILVAFSIYFAKAHKNGSKNKTDFRDYLCSYAETVKQSPNTGTLTTAINLNAKQFFTSIYKHLERHTKLIFNSILFRMPPLKQAKGNTCSFRRPYAQNNRNRI